MGAVLWNYNLCGLCWKIFLNILALNIHGKMEHIGRNLNVKIVTRLLILVKLMKFHMRAKHIRPAIGQLPRVSREDPERIRVDSVFETSVLCLFFSCKQIFSFSLFQPSLFIQYSTEECSTVQVFIWCLDTIA